MINIDDKTRRLSQSTIVIGYKQENKAESIEFKIPDYLKEYGKKICFKTKDGKVFSKLFDNTTSNIFTFTRTETQYGELNATIQFFKTQNEDMIVYKTSMLHIIFNETINCEDEVQPDEPKIPILESLIEKVTELNETITENEETRNNNENIRISNENERKTNEKERETYYTNIQNKVNNGEFNGATYLPNVDAEGNITWTNDKGLENPSVQNIRGPQGIQGPQGEAFKIKKTYSSIEAMQNDFDNMEVGDYAMIATSIELEDNAKLYARTETEWIFITDFSGATGIQGPQGIQGIQGAQGERGIGISKLEVKQGYLYVTLTDNSTQNAGLIITDEVKQWLVNEITNNAESTFNQYYNTKVSEFNENVQAKLDEYNANAEALANKVVELETENTSLKNQIPSGEATGNPIHLSDSSDMECEIVPIGNAEQETREGYNILNPTNLTLFNSNKYISTIDYLSTGTIEVDSNTTYSLIRKKDGTFTDAGFYVYDSNNSNKTSASAESVVNGNYKVTKFTTKSDSKYFGFYFGETEKTYTSVEECLLQNEMMLLKGDYSTGTIPKYEQYGASPSPDYPSEIVTVGQNVNILTYPFTDATKTTNGITFTDNGDGTITANGTATAHAYFNLSRPTLKAGDYAIGGIPEGASIATYFVKFGTTNYTSNSVFTITKDFTPSESYIRITSGVTVNNLVFKIKLVEGTEVGGYSPYGQGSVEIGVVNKNYLNFLNKSGNASGLDYSCNKNAINLNGTPNTSYNIRNIIETTKLKAGTYTFSANIGKFSISNSCQFHFRDKYNNAIVTLNLWGTGYKKTVTFEDDIEIDGNRSYFYTNKNVVFSQDKFVLQIEPGTVATEPVEHESYTKVLPIQKEFVKIGDYEDTFIKQDGKWYEKHYISKEIFNGAETWYRDALQGDNKYYSFYADLTPVALGDSKCLCNLLTYNNGIYSTDKLGIFINWQGKARLKLKIDTITTVDELKEYLTANNITVYYILKEPELIPCTAEQESTLNSFYTYKNVTNISMSGIGTLKVNYKKDLETLFNNIIKQIPSSTSDTTET